jgi:hypothetical protein
MIRTALILGAPVLMLGCSLTPTVTKSVDDAG